MNVKLKELLLSKRVLAFLLTLVIFVVLIHTTSFGPVELGTGLTLIGTAYILGETIRKSDPK